MYFDLVLKYLPLFQVGAVIVGSGILSLAIAAELYDVEQVTLTPPGGPAPITFSRYKYRSPNAQFAREDFYALSDVVYVVLLTLLLILSFSLVLEGGIQLAEAWGSSSGGERIEGCHPSQGFYRFMFCQLTPLARDASEAARDSQQKLVYPVGVFFSWVMIFSALLIFWFGVTVRRVVRIRAG